LEKLKFAAEVRLLGPDIPAKESRIVSDDVFVIFSFLQMKQANLFLCSRLTQVQENFDCESCFEKFRSKKQWIIHEKSESHQVFSTILSFCFINSIPYCVRFTFIYYCGTKKKILKKVLYSSLPIKIILIIKTENFGIHKSYFVGKGCLKFA
jgi:hypothetical protein